MAAQGICLGDHGGELLAYRGGSRETHPAPSAAPEESGPHEIRRLVNSVKPVKSPENNFLGGKGEPYPYLQTWDQGAGSSCGTDHLPPVSTSRVQFWECLGECFNAETSVVASLPPSLPSSASGDSRLPRAALGARQGCPSPSCGGHFEFVPAGVGNTLRAATPTGRRDPPTLSLGPSPSAQNLLSDPIPGRFPGK